MELVGWGVGLLLLLYPKVVPKPPLKFKTLLCKSTHLYTMSISQHMTKSKLLSSRWCCFPSGWLLSLPASSLPTCLPVSAQSVSHKNKLIRHQWKDGEGNTVFFFLSFFLLLINLLYCNMSHAKVFKSSQLVMSGLVPVWTSTSAVILHVRLLLLYGYSEYKLEID